MSHPLVPFRIKKIIPNVKIIVILRNPIDRAFSHYQDSKRQKVESLTFEDALFSRNKQLEKEMENLKNKQFDGHFYERFSYIQRGIYSDALSLWFKVFPRNQFLILKTEDLENKLNDTMNDVFEFLKIPRFTINNSSRKNVGKYDQMKSSTRKSLIEFYKPHNKKLKELLKINFDWDK